MVSARPTEAQSDMDLGHFEASPFVSPPLAVPDLSPAGEVSGTMRGALGLEGWRHPHGCQGLPAHWTKARQCHAIHDYHSTRNEA